MKENLLKQIIKKNQEIVVLSDSKEFVNNLDKLIDKKVDIILVDSVFDFFSFEAYIFREDIESIVLINDVYDKKEFVTNLTKNLLNIFEKRNQFKPIILYPQTDYKYKDSLVRISQLCKPYINYSKIDCNNSALLYIGQYGTSGYASAAKSYIADYVLKGTNIYWQSLKFDDSKLDESFYVDSLAKSAMYKKYKKYDRAILHTTPDLWKNYIKDFNGRINSIIGYCTWETTKLPNSWVDYINQVDRVMVPSTFNKQSFIESGVTSDIQVVPHLWFEQKLPDKKDIRIVDFYGNIVPCDKYTFYCISELNQRKGVLDLVKIFDQLNDTNKQLILKIHYKNYEKSNIEHCLRILHDTTKNIGKNIYLILTNINNSELLSLHSFGDCLVSLNRGEGFGLTIFDAFNLKKKIITTGFGGQTDFLTNNYSGLVNYKLVPVNGMNSFNKNYTSDQLWAEPDLEHAKYLMSI